MNTRTHFAYALGLAAMALAMPSGQEGLLNVSVARATDSLEMPKDIIADQIRRQGFACEKPASAERDPTLSKPDQAVWILKCEGVSYRVRLIPDMAATVERLD